jgi:hypothetical protein
MKTQTLKTEFVRIPRVGFVEPYSVDPLNRAHVSALIKRAESYFLLAAKDWETGNNSGDSKFYRRMERQCAALRSNGATLLAQFDIKTDFPGLYPHFTVNGFDEHTVTAAVLAAIGHPRNWLSPVKPSQHFSDHCTGGEGEPA